MKFLITGASGQLGCEFQRRFEKDGVDYTAPPESKLDVTDPVLVREAVETHRPDVVLNCAAYNDVEKAESDCENAYKVNASAVRNIAEVCAENGVRLVHYSTDYVFDGTKQGFYTEQDPTSPLNNYGNTKLAGERAVVDRGSLNVDRKSEHVQNTKHAPQSTNSRAPTYAPLVLRVSWVYGPGQQNFFYKLQQWAQKNEVLKVVWDQISVPTSTADIVPYTLQAVDAGVYGVYHLTNSGYASRYEIARYFFKKLGNDKLILPVSTSDFAPTASRPYFSKMSNAVLSRILDTPIPSWQDAVDRFITNNEN